MSGLLMCEIPLSRFSIQSQKKWLDGTVELIKIFDSFEDQIVQDNRVVIPSDSIWINLCENVLKNSYPEAIYTAK